jgi:hypothetical protein
MILFAILLIATAILISTEFGWRGALFYTVVIGFLQDPIRKVAEGSTYYGGLAFACFLITFLALKNVNRYWYATYLFWTNQKLLTLLPIFYYLIGFQALNSFARIGDVRLSIIGMLFYTLPLLALWVGFHLGKNQTLLREFLRVYVVCCSLCAVSVLLDAQGVQNPLFNEVGKGLGITGIGEGNSGLWRTSEIAGWHLAAGACFSFILGITSKNSFQQNVWFFLTIGLTFLTHTTGRRKALGIVIVFISLFLLYYSFSSQRSRIFRIITSVFLVIAVSLSSYGLIFNESSQQNLDKYEERTAGLTLDESQSRFNSGLQRLVRGVQIAGPFGFGVGAGSNTGDTGITTSSLGQQSLGYVTEGGGGRIVAELGYLGAIYFLYVIAQLGLLYYRNFKLGLIEVPSDQFNILVGLLLFVIANAVSFFQAAQLYSDLFVLIIIGICFGSFLAVPLLASEFHQSKLIQSQR